MPDRPLSPHLSVYKYRYTLVSSIVNRGTGLVLSIGLLVLLYWTLAILGGPQSYAQAQMVLSLPVFKLVFAGLLFTFSYHLIAGIRHLIWDTGRYMERRESQTSAWTVGIVSVLVTLGLLYWAFCPAGAP